MRFLPAEAFLELEIVSPSPRESQFGTPSGADVIVSFSLENVLRNGHELVTLQDYVRRFVQQLQPGCECFVAFDGACSASFGDSAAARPATPSCSELRLWVLLYADLVISISGSERTRSFESLPSLMSVTTDAAQAATPDRSHSSSPEEELFGPADSIPEDQRARVWLERFVVIVKIAMVGGRVPIDKLFVSNSAQTRACISKGAQVLSEAVSRTETASKTVSPRTPKASSDLEYALDWYLCQITAALPDSEELIRSLASDFIAKLSSRWQSEADLQERRFRHLLDRCLNRAQEYALNWLSLSAERVESIKQGSRNDPLPVLVVGGLPVVIALAIFGVPYDRPDAGHPLQGWLKNPLFVFYCWPVTQFTCWILFPEWLRMTAFPELSLRGAVCWTISVILIVSAGVSVFSVMTGIFPVPFLTVVNMAASMPFFPLMWYCIPYSVRQRPGAKRRVFWSTVGIIMLIVIFGMFFPLFNMVFQRVAGVHQSYMVFFFLATRVAFEKINKMLAKKLSPDMFPLTVMLAVYAYEFAMCIMMSSIRHTFVIIVLIGADLVENMFHLWCLYKKGKDDPQREVDDPSSPFPGRDGSRLCLVSVLLVRELVELLVPVQLIVIILALQFGPGKPFNELVSGFPDGVPPELGKMLRYLVIDVIAEGAVFMVACLVLRAQGLRPLLLLRGVISANHGSYFAIALGCVMFYLQLQHSHFGVDFSFRLLWISEEHNAVWSHGTVWEA